MVSAKLKMNDPLPETKERREAGAGVKFRLLMWKNFLQQIRHRTQTAAEIFVPALSMALVLILRSQVEPTNVEQPLIYPPIPADSLNYSTTVLLGMNLTQMSVAYSPESPILDDVLRTSMATLLTKNAMYLVPVIGQLFPEIVDNLPQVNLTIVENILKNLITIDAYNSSESLTGIYLREEYTRKVVAGVQFDDSLYGATELPSNLSYTLRFPERPRLSSFFSSGARTWRTSFTFPLYELPGPRLPDAPEGGNDPGYMREMFIALQHSISSELISRVSGQDVRSLDVYVQRYPHPPYVIDLAVQLLQLMLPLFLLLSFSYTAANMVRAVTIEKELQLKETMKIMGLPTWLHWSAWFCKHFLFLLLVAVFIVVLLKVQWFTTETGFSDYSMFTNTPWTVLFFFLMLYFVSIIFFAFMMSGFFSSANTAALFTGIIWFLSYIPAGIITIDSSVSFLVQLSTCLSINCAMAYGLQIMLSKESIGGLQWGDFFTTYTNDTSRLLFGHTVLMLLLDCVIYMCIALYLEQVLPGPYGTPRPWYFLFQKEFWRESRERLDNADLANTDIDLDVTKEDDPQDHAVGVKISNLTKVYNGNKAVNNLSLNIYDDQITVLLGHNGAGKSTTISMITGNTSPSGGSIWVAGYDMAHQPQSARAQIGLCPQHNVLFPDLTVREHLHFFGRLKGFFGKELEAEIDELIEKLELTEKRDAKSSSLSGGQKRRLCVGVALSGRTRVVLLDEPTSGMDPASRRALWDLLQTEKKNRSIILTTHFMDEADYLGDRIAIMCTGRLQCVGSPYFLKRHYGVGYTLVVVKAPHFQLDACTDLVQKYMPALQLNEDRGSEVTYTLSNDYSHVFAEMLKEMERRQQEIGFLNFGLTATTIEDVFMTVGSDSEPATLENDDVTTTASEFTLDEVTKNETGSTEKFAAKESTYTGWELQVQHVSAVWLKLWLVWSRSWGLVLLQIMVPVVLMLATLFVYNYIIALTEAAPARELTLAQGFKETNTYLNFNGTSTSSIGAIAYAAYEDKFTSSGVTGMDLTVLNEDIQQYYLAQSADQQELATMRNKMVVGATFSDNLTVAWFSNFGYHDVAVSLGAVHDALLRALVPGASLTVTNYPLEATYENSSDIQLIASTLAMQLSNGIGTSLSIASAVFIMFYVKERVSRAKLIQKASGIQPVVLWGAAAVFDWLWFMLVCVTFVIICAAFQVHGLNDVTQLGRFYLCLMVYGASMLPVIYLFSFLFTAGAQGFVVLFFVNALFGLMGAQIVTSLYSLGTTFAADIVDGILSVFPLYSGVMSVQKLLELELLEWSCLRACDHLSATLLPGTTECTIQYVCENFSDNCCFRQESHFEWESPGVLRYFVTMLVVAAGLWAVLLIIEYRLVQKLMNGHKSPAPVDESSLDEDVVAEMRHVEALRGSGRDNHNLVAANLTKYYGSNLAVNQLSFSVSDSECFGLLGVNGAGKTTTFKMLMGDENISHGDAYVRGNSVQTQLRKVHKDIGYCPQFDALFEELTGRETLRLYAMLRGVRGTAADQLQQSLAHSLGFTQHLDKRVHQYSGGNKRKLSTAVSMMGYTRLVFLDEPTTGVDPAAKRQVWRAIRRATHSGRSVVLTSHSMEECEALCSRLTIMVNGQFKCLGTPQHLKNKFSQGFTLTIKMKIVEDGSTTEINRVKSYVNVHFTNPKLMEEYRGLITFYLPDLTVKWSEMFGIMERAKQTYAIEDYSISQTTLEQIFLQFTKYQNEALT